MSHKKRKQEGDTQLTNRSPKRKKTYTIQLSSEIFIEFLQYISDIKTLVLYYAVLMQSKKLTEKESKVLYNATNYCLSKLKFIKYKNFNTTPLCNLPNSMYSDSKYYITKHGFLYGLNPNTKECELLGKSRHNTEPVHNSRIQAFATTDGLKVRFDGVPYFFKIIAKKLECGNNHLLILTANNEVYGFGDNTKGQLSKSSFERNIITRLVLIKTHVQSISAGGDTSAFVTLRGHLYVHGMNQIYSPWKNVQDAFSVIATSNNIIIVLTSSGNVYYILEYYSLNYLSDVKKLHIPKACRIWKEIGKTREFTIVQIENHAYIIENQLRLIKCKKVFDTIPSIERDPVSVNLIHMPDVFTAFFSRITEHKAELILNYRNEHGYFNNEKDIQKIPKIGKKTVEQIMRQNVSFRKRCTIEELKRINI